MGVILLAGAIFCEAQVSLFVATAVLGVLE